MKLLTIIAGYTLTAGPMLPAPVFKPKVEYGDLYSGPEVMTLFLDGHVIVQQGGSVVILKDGVFIWTAQLVGDSLVDGNGHVVTWNADEEQAAEIYLDGESIGSGSVDTDSGRITYDLPEFIAPIGIVGLLLAGVVLGMIVWCIWTICWQLPAPGLRQIHFVLGLE